MTLRLFDSLTRELRDFVPVVPGKAGIYICGLTTQAPPHLGHVRFAVAFDVLRRWMTRGHGLDVTLIRNVTDIDDKILAKSAENGEAWFAVSYRNEVETAAALEALGVLPPTYEPRATGHVPEMVALMETLVEKGHAYAAADGSGDVYFDVRSWPGYGELTRQKVDDMVDAEDADPRGKRDPRDFALWKGRKADEPETASWPTPFGAGRPGWHLECSAMARKYLGDTFDIHGGGVDLRFPHHENEMAQSRAAGLGFANYWLHNAWVTMGGEKMSKSLGNSLRVSEVRQGAPPARRPLLPHRRPLPVDDRVPRGVDRGVGARPSSASRASCAGPCPASSPPCRPATRPSPRTSARRWTTTSACPARWPWSTRPCATGNTALDDGDHEDAAAIARVVIAMTDVLGVNPLDPAWSAGDSGAADALASLDALVQERISARAHARSARDYDTADAIRDELAAAGIALEDTAAGARWSLARGRSE